MLLRPRIQHKYLLFTRAAKQFQIIRRPIDKQ